MAGCMAAFIAFVVLDSRLRGNDKNGENNLKIVTSGFPLARE
jgi:hypothetical protein